MTNAAIKMPEPDDQLEIVYLLREDIDSVWSCLFGLIEPACDETITPRDVYEMLHEGKALAWLIFEDGEPLAAAVTRQHERHGNLWLDVLTIGGADWHKWAPMLHAAFVEHARNIGCDTIMAHVRRGLEKWLARLGWRVKQVHMEYRIDGR